MSRRVVNPARRLADSASIPFGGTLQSKSRSSPLLSIGLVLLGAIFLIAFSYSGSGWSRGDIDAVSKFQGGVSCTLELHRAFPILKKAYGDSMHKVLHVGPDTCSVVSKLLKEEDTEAWGVEPYDLDDADNDCRTLVRKGIVRVADIKFPLPYRAKSFSLVIVSDALDYLSPRYLNKTLPELARVSSKGLVIFTGYPGQQRAKVAELSKFGRPAKLRSSSWWIRYFVQTSLEENEAATKKTISSLSELVVENQDPANRIHVDLNFFLCLCRSCYVILLVLVAFYLFVLQFVCKTGKIFSSVYFGENCIWMGV
ncbi:hypothetical protein Nepgr_015413 [Nepenthes gracilis]|uniref:Pectin methylesterase CGR3 n=1 Tax=Nepenthes gracilis TaxID=150966 RepID=A0AAD3XQD3_NEPGR|nr:hypothetical protein Nepgr_015413 [Nepenthes gracilis]